MHSRPTHTACQQPKRRGLSVVETMGCLVSLSGGIVLGSLYLGVDLQDIATEALEQTESLDLGYFGTSAKQETTAAQEQTSDLDNSQDATNKSAEQTPVASEQPVEGEALDVETNKPVLPSPPVETFTSSGAVGTEFEQDTRKVWDALARCIEQETAGRKIESIDDGAGLLFEYLTQRKNAHATAVESLKRLRTVKVDKRLNEHVVQVLHWNQAGVKLYNRAASLLTDSPSENLIGPIAQSWQSAATQHRMEEKLMREKHLALAGYLANEFKSLSPFVPAAAP